MMATVIPDETESDDDLSLARSLTRQLNFASNFTVPRVTDLASLDTCLSETCGALFQSLSSKELEATFQRCLAIDLKEAGAKLCQEVEIILTYKGLRVGTRRADIVVETPSDGKRAVIELKAVSDLSSNHLKQLQFYMHHLDIDTGFLINFPHDRCFPDVPNTEASDIFVQTVLLGDPGVLSDRNTRGRHADKSVQIIKLVRGGGRRVKVAVEGPRFVAPIAQTTEQPCRRCIALQRRCKYHPS